MSESMAASLDPAVRDVEVVVVGAGPAGLAAATTLARAGVRSVEVLEREANPGGIPRHSHHTGYGIRDLHRVMSGPRYAQHHIDAASRAGAIIRTQTSVTSCTDALTLSVTSPKGIELIRARAIVLATGARERPRPARLIPGGRGQGVMTTGQLQQMVYEFGQPVGKRAVIIGAEHVSFSAVVTLRHAGVDVAAMVTDHPRHQSYAAFRLGIIALSRFPILTRSTVRRIIGRSRVEAVEISTADGQTKVIECDTVICTGDWIPDHELARSAGLRIDAGTLGPAIDGQFHTSRRGIFAAGNLLRGVETADVVSLEGRCAARSVLTYLQNGDWESSGIAVTVRPGLCWVTPNQIGPSDKALLRDRFTIWSNESRRFPRVVARQGGVVLWQHRSSLFVVPNRPFALPARWLQHVDFERGAIEISLE